MLTAQNGRPVQHMISDHALLRWLSRSKGINIEAYRDQYYLKYGAEASDGRLVGWLTRHYKVDMEILRETLYQACSNALHAGASRYFTPDGTFCFNNGVLATVLRPGMKQASEI